MSTPGLQNKLGTPQSAGQTARMGNAIVRDTIKIYVCLLRMKHLNFLKIETIKTTIRVAYS